MRNLLKTLLAVSASQLAVGSAHAILLAYEGFEDYSPSTSAADMETINGGTGWAAPFDANLPTAGFPTETRNINYSNGTVNVNGGNRSFYQDASNSYTLDRSWSTPYDISSGSGNALYVSFLWQTRTGETSPASAGDTNSFFQVIVGEDASDFFYGVINRFVSGPDDHFWQARYNNVVTAGPSSTADDVYLVVFKIESGQSSVFINPDSTIEGVPTMTQAGAALGSTWDAVDQIRIRNAIGVANWNIDELRVGTEFSDVVVVPEPSTYALIAGSLGLAAICLRRRKR